jgi:hypothetical protein
MSDPDWDDRAPMTPDAEAYARNPFNDGGYPMPDGSTVDGSDVTIIRQGHEVRRC